MCSEVFLRCVSLCSNLISLCLHYCRSAPELDVVVIPEREKDLDWKTGERNSGTRNRNRCCNGPKSEAPKSGQSAESCLKQNGGPPVSAASLTCLGSHLTGLTGVQQVCILLAPGESAPWRGAVAFASQAQTPAARRGAWGPAEGAGEAGAAPAVWRETKKLGPACTPAHTPALPHQEKVKTDRH